MPTEPAVQLHDVVVRYGKHVALDHTELEAKTGVVTGLIGPNGAGKTTTLRLISGLVQPDRGTVAVLGLDPARNSIRVRRRLCFLPDRPVLPTHLSVLELLRLRAGVFGIDAQVVQERIETISEQLDIASLLSRWCGSLSHGQA
jgi:ABC-2 type transport system ATP-binding protein